LLQRNTDAVYKPVLSEVEGVRVIHTPSAFLHLHSGQAPTPLSRGDEIATPAFGRLAMTQLKWRF